MPLRDEFRSIIDNAVKAIHNRLYFAQYPEHPKAYGEEAPGKAFETFNALIGQEYTDLDQNDADAWIGEETSPYTGKPLGITYPSFNTKTLVERANAAFKTWKNVSVDDRAEVLVASLEAIKHNFHLIAQATQHTTGQAYMMSFQASGPHSNDRALEALALGYQELTRFPGSLIWEKPMGPTSVVLHKQFKPVPKGVGLVIGCSTFPVWNSVPGLYASLITGNPVIVKPHPKSVLPIAVVVAEIRKTLKAAGYDPNVVQLAVDGSNKLITKELAEHSDVKVIDYTGSSSFGDYIESLPNKVVFTEKAGVNSVILDSANDLKPVLQNLSFAVSLYSGQMCTAPQNIFIPAAGVKTAEGVVSYEDVVNAFKDAVAGLTSHPKAGPGTLGAIQSDATYERAKNSGKLGGKVLLAGADVANAEYPEARVYAPSIIELDAEDAAIYENELFGPIVLIIKTKDTAQSVALAKKMAKEHGAITCAAYTTDADTAAHIFEEMESVFTPVSLNLTGNIWVNQHAAFSDFHVTGGNPAGNASFTNPEYVNKRFVWVGHRSVQ